MVEISRRKRLNLPVAPLAAGTVATITALVFALLPGGILDNLVLDSGIAAVIPAAEPPLGLTARALLVLIGGGGVGLIAWFALYLLIGTRSIAILGSDASKSAEIPVLRRADAHPDAPARRPLFANSDLGTPFLEVRAPVHITAEELAEAVPALAPAPPVVAPAVRMPPVEAPLPVDLDQPLAAFDPQAIPDEPIAWFVPPRPTPPAAPSVQPERPQTFTSSERFETFELKPAPAKPARSDFDASASIHSLLDRLEKSVARREPEIVVPIVPPRHDSLQEALTTLRRLATR
ncbi:hypothetical protein ASG11_13165 [Sphingomonas sp. Leaf357]|uniref:hypothetical protein n=1 Tax=Sphingomonas sp. Leaf357 TaxID=1736350 RepID=UPI0006F802AD|nr:hypothetical protein [Sphingomonas sp. Leaf357]KQS01779.1 hypothetical protein ASG11_13165 [Sphingomonas sp. Leaf357]